MVANGYLLVDPEAGSDQHDVRGWTNGAFAWLAHEDAWPSLEHVGTIAFLLDDLIRALGFRVSVQEHEHGFTARSDDGSWSEGGCHSSEVEALMAALQAA